MQHSMPSSCAEGMVAKETWGGQLVSKSQQDKGQ